MSSAQYGVALLSSVFLVLALSLIATRWMIQNGPRDYPNGNHKAQPEPMPTSGGVGFALPVLIVGFGAHVFVMFAGLNMPFIALTLGSLAAMALGYVDDNRPIKASFKLLTQIFIALFMATSGIRVETLDLGRQVIELGPIFGTLGSAAWIVVVTNAVNFMDGSDGMMAGSGIIMSISLAILAASTGSMDVAILAAILAGGLFGFLYWNRNGTIFSGDSGALFLGCYLSGLILIWISSEGLSVWLGPLILIGFLTDVFLTLIWRARNNKNLFDPHRDHVYQIALRAGLSHSLVAIVYAWVAVHGALTAGIMLLFPKGTAILGFAVLVIILVSVGIRIRRSAERMGFLSTTPKEA